MFDSVLRRASAPAIGRVAQALVGVGVRADGLTAVGLASGLGAAGAAASGWWWAAFGLWLASRVIDGLDGAVARIRGASARGGFVDLVADFTVYGAFVVGIAVQRPDARLAAVVVLCAYYVSGAAFLAWSSLAVSRPADAAVGGLAHDDDRSVRFVGGVAEGFETIVVYAVICLLPDHAATILWIFAAMVAVTAAQRIQFALGDLHSGRDHRPGGAPPHDVRG